MGVNFLLLEKLFSGLVDKLGDILRGAVFDALRGFFYFIASAIYSLMIKLYKLFIAMSRGRLLDNEVLEVITGRIGLLLGLIMLFYVVISFIRMLVEPDTLVDSKKGAPGVIKKVLIVIVLLGFSSFAFDTLYSIQTIIINEGVISKIVWPSDDTLNVDQFGNIMAAELFTTFYKVDSRLEDNDEAIVNLCRNKLNRLKTDIYDSGDFSSGKDCLSEELELDTITVTTSTGEVVQKQYEGSSLHVMELDWLLLIGFGIAYVYFFISYAISVGVRMIQLTILEIISPMAFISYLAPKEGMFMNWLKVYFSTYVDVFIRVAIINLSMFLIAQIITTMSSNGTGEFWKTVNVSEDSRSLVMITIFIALLVFAKRVPDLIKQLFPNMSGLGFGGFHIKDALGLGTTLGIGAAATVGSAVGLIGGGINGVVGGVRRNGIKGLWHGVTGAAGGLLSGGFHGIDNGIKNRGNAFKASGSSFREQMLRNTRSREAIEDGSTFGGRMIATLQHGLGVQSAGQRDKRNIETLSNYNKTVEEIKGYADTGIKAVRDAKREFEFIQQGGRLRGENEAHYVARLNAARKKWKDAQEQAVNDVISGASFSSDDLAGAAKIHSALGGLDRMYEENQQLFDELKDHKGNSIAVKKITSFADMDTYGSYASAGAVTIESSPEYSRHQADDSYAYWEARERGGRIPPGTGGGKR